MSVTQEQFDIVQARGDIAVVSLQAIRSASQNTQIRLLTMVDRLQKMKLPMTTEDGKPTIANVIMDELAIMNTALTDIFAIANTVTEEMTALAEQHGVARTTDETVKDIIDKIRRSVPAYVGMSDDQIRKEFGL